MSPGKYKVLLVDDSEDDRFFMCRALRENCRLSVVAEAADGEETIAYLGGQGTFSDREKHPFPDVLILDLKMPRKNGFDVLQWLQGQSFHKPVVIVISGSFLPEDIAKSYSLGADAYHKKTAFKEEQASMVREIEESLAKRHDG